MRSGKNSRCKSQNGPTAQHLQEQEGHPGNIRAGLPYPPRCWSGRARPPEPARLPLVSTTVQAFTSPSFSRHTATPAKPQAPPASPQPPPPPLPCAAAAMLLSGPPPAPTPPLLLPESSGE